MCQPNSVRNGSRSRSPSPSRTFRTPGERAGPTQPRSPPRLRTRILRGDAASAPRSSRPQDAVADRVELLADGLVVLDLVVGIRMWRAWTCDQTGRLSPPRPVEPHRWKPVGVRSAPYVAGLHVGDPLPMNDGSWSWPPAQLAALERGLRCRVRRARAGRNPRPAGPAGRCRAQGLDLRHFLGRRRLGIESRMCESSYSLFGSPARSRSSACSSSRGET